MAVNGFKWIEVVKNGWKFLGITEKWLILAKTFWKWLELTGIAKKG